MRIAYKTKVTDVRLEIDIGAHLLKRNETFMNN